MSFILVAIACIASPLGGASGAARTGAQADAHTDAPSEALPAGASSDWWSEAQQRIARSEYEMTWQERPLVAELAPSWHAPNRAQGFRTYFTDDGPRVIPRSDDSPAWQWGLRFSGIERGETVLGAKRAVPAPRANRITYSRGSVVEWYLNDERGLEQGLTLAAPPEEHPEWPGARGAGRHDAGADAPLAVVFILDGDLSPIVSADGQAIDFVTPSGARALRYAELRVTDGAGRPVAARMDGWSDKGTRGIRILIEDKHATWPLEIDPLLTSASWTAESDQVLAFFGISIATAGDVNGDGYSDVIAGASSFDNGETDEGRAFVFHGSASGLSLTPSWTAEGDQGGAQLGWAVGTAGDVNGDGVADVIVGAYSFDDGESDEGRAFVYHGSAAGLSTTPSWTAESDQAGAQFGYSVGTAGDVNTDGYSDVIVGAWFFDNGEPDEGRAFVYHGSAAGLSATASWTAESDQAGAQFGYSVGMAGDVNADGYADVIVGAISFDNGQADEGRTFVYHGSPSGLSATANWTAEGDQANAQFGNAVGTAGDVNGDGYADVIVGAYFFFNGEGAEGGAFVYQGSASGLSLTANWTAEGNQGGAVFGYSVGTAGDVNGDGYADVVVGAPSFTNGQSQEGRAFVYQGTASGLSSTPSWTAESNQASAQFGTSVGTAGDVNGDGYADVVVGSPFFTNGQTMEGRAFAYHGSASGLSLTAGWTATGTQPLAPAKFGYSVATAGDVNGDGYADVIVGAPLFDPQLGGRAFVYHGSAAGLSPTANWTAAINEQGAGFGQSVGTAGDVNGDGYADVIVGAPFFEAVVLDEGGAFVYHGSASGLSPTPNWTSQGNQANARLGASVGTAGDVNGDGYADIIVGAPFLGNGRSLVYHGSAAGLSPTASWTAQGGQPGSEFGSPVGTAGDVNGDGYTDIIVGARLAGGGRAFVYHGSAAGLSLTPNWSVANLAASVAAGTAGDVNGDGYSDVIVAGYMLSIVVNDDVVQVGIVYVYHGSASGLSLSGPQWVATGSQEFADFGFSVGTVGDVNGDGYADVIVGAPKFHNSQFDEGRAYVYHGSASGLSLTSDWTADGNVSDARFGSAVGTAGDVNGDGYADIIVGAPLLDWFQQDAAGRAFLYLGNGGSGLSVRPQQRRKDDLASISPLGSSESGNGFRLAALGRTPFGRGLVKLEWEVKPLGVLFDGTGTQMSPGWIDSGTAGAALSELVTAPRLSVLHWRARLRYHPATTPLQSRSRWFTVPGNGWQEADLRTPSLSDLSVTQSDQVDPAFSGSPLTYALSVSNSGPDAAVATTLLDTLPAGSSFVSALPSQGTCGLGSSGGEVQCALGSMQVGAQVSIAVTVTFPSPGSYTNTVSVLHPGPGSDPDGTDNLSSETTTALPGAPGDRVWLDANGNGIQDPGETGAEDVLVALYDGAGSLLAATLTDASGAYAFPNQVVGATYRIRVIPPIGSVLTTKDQGADDGVDSDADPVTQLTPAFVFGNLQDPFRWDAGLRDCVPPDERIFISMVTLSGGGTNYPILHYQDPNQPGQVTGYNVYRSTNKSLPPASWPLVASNVIDMDEATPNKQWVDSSGDVPPGGIWYYQVTAYNSQCGAQGPF